MRSYRGACVIVIWYRDYSRSRKIEAVATRTLHHMHMYQYMSWRHYHLLWFLLRVSKGMWRVGSNHGVELTTFHRVTTDACVSLEIKLIHTLGGYIPLVYTPARAQCTKQVESCPAMSMCCVFGHYLRVSNCRSARVCPPIGWCVNIQYVSHHSVSSSVYVYIHPCAHRSDVLVATIWKYYNKKTATCAM